MTIGGSIALIIVGAVLRFGITWKPSHVDLQAIGLRGPARRHHWGSPSGGGRQGRGDWPARHP